MQAILLEKALAQRLAEAADKSPIDQWISESQSVSAQDLTANNVRRIPHYVHSTPTLTLEQVY